MIKTTRSRLEIRQEPDRTSSLVGVFLIAVGGAEAALSLAALIDGWSKSGDAGVLLAFLRLLLSALFAASGWFFLRGRSRVVVDLEHRMVARYMGVGSGVGGGNQSWDLQEFGSVVVVRPESRRALSGVSSRAQIVCLRRPDGSDLELYWSGEDAAEAAARVAAFAGLPLLDRRS